MTVRLVRLLSVVLHNKRDKDLLGVREKAGVGPSLQSSEPLVGMSDTECPYFLYLFETRLEQDLWLSQRW
jgi:hypothetical protein